MTRYQSTRNRRMGDKLFMHRLRRRFFLTGLMPDDEVYRLCGDSFNADLVELELAGDRLMFAIRESWLVRRIFGR